RARLPPDPEGVRPPRAAVRGGPAPAHRRPHRRRGARQRLSGPEPLLRAVQALRGGDSGPLRVDQKTPRRDQAPGATLSPMPKSRADWVINFSFFMTLAAPWVTWLSMRLARRRSHDTHRLLQLVLLGLCTVAVLALEV